MLARISGVVLSVATRQGKSRANDTPYRLSDVTVLVANRGTAVYTINELADGAPRPPQRFEVVDVLVEFDVYNGQISGRYQAEHDDAEPLLLADALAS